MIDDTISGTKYDAYQDLTEVTGSKLLQDNLEKDMNNVNGTDVTLLSLATGSFGLVGSSLLTHDFPVAIGLTVLGVILVYCYHRFGSSTN